MLSCNRAVVTDFHVRVMRIVARAAEAYGNASLRLDGGTALAAYYLGHRESEDLDFFSDYGVDQPHFAHAVMEHAAAEGVMLEQRPGTSTSRTYIRLFADAGPSRPALKMDFAAQSPFRLEPLEPTTEGIRVGSFRDITANKLHAVCDRFEARDYIDVHAILTRGMTGTPDENTVRERFRDLIRDLLEIDPGLNSRLVGDAVDRGLNRPLLASFPLAIFIPMTETDVQRTLLICAEECAAMVAKSRQDLS